MLRTCFSAVPLGCRRSGGRCPPWTRPRPSERASRALAATCLTVPEPIAIGARGRSGQGTLVGADDLEVLVDEDVVRPVDTDVVDLVLAVAQLHDTVDDAARVGGQRSFRRLVRCGSADDRPGPFCIVRRDLADLL